MTHLEIMERGLDATYALYMNEYTKQGYQPEDLENGAHEFSAMALISTMNGPSRFYTRQNNLRYEMAAIGADGIKNELLKNVVNVDRKSVV